MQPEERAMPQLKPWLDRLAPVVEQARQSLVQQNPEDLARRSGCDRDQDGKFRLDFLGMAFVIDPQDFGVCWAHDGQVAPSFFSSLILTYLATADGTPPSGHLVGFRELPDGIFYNQAFQSYSGDRLARELNGGLAAFRAAGPAVGGTALDLGDAAFTFQVLPRICMGVAYWEGDEDFPARAQVLFEDSAAHYMPNHGLAILGSVLVGRLLKAGG